MTENTILRHFFVIQYDFIDLKLKFFLKMVTKKFNNLQNLLFQIK